MKKTLLTITLTGAISSAYAGTFTPINYETSPAVNDTNYVGTTTDGVAVIARQIGDEDASISISMIDTNYDPSLTDLLAQSEQYLENLLPWPDGYASGLLSNYPALPDNPIRFTHLGINESTTSQEYKAIADGIIVALRAEIIGKKYLYKDITGYTARAVSGNHILVADFEVTASEGHIHYCNVGNWDFNQLFSDNLSSCQDLGYATYLVDLKDLNFSGSGYEDNFKYDGIGIVKRQLPGDTPLAELLLLSPGRAPITLASGEVNGEYKKVTLTSGKNPYIIYRDTNNSEHAYHFINGELRELDGAISDFHRNSDYPQGDIFDIAGDRIYYVRDSQMFFCQKDTLDFSQEYTYEAFIDVNAQGGWGGAILSTYPLKPDNYEQLIIDYDLQSTFPSGISDAEFKDLVDGYYYPAYADLESRIYTIGCFNDSEHLVDSASVTRPYPYVNSSGHTQHMGLKLMNELNSPLSSYGLLLISYNDQNQESDSLNNMLLQSLIDSGYKNAVDRLFSVIDTTIPGLISNYPNLPEDPAASGLPENITLVQYRAIIANMILSAPVFIGAPSVNNDLRFMPFFHYDFVNGAIYFDGGKYSFSDLAAQAASIVVNPEKLTIDPYQNAYSSLTIDIQGQAYATEVSCSVDTSALNITGSNYGDWGGENRLTLPLNWGSQNMSGAITHTGNSELEENGTLLSADLFADMTTTTANVVCSAALSDASGNLIPVTVQNATITIDDGIHGGNGGFSGSIEIPVGVNPEDITVSVTINGRTITTGVDSAGNFSFDELRDGDFTIAFNADNYVQSCMNHSISEGANIDVGQITLFAGDINDDGEINIADFTYLAGKYGSANGDELYDQKADLNKDSVINVQDLAILASHFGSVQCNPQ